MTSHAYNPRIAVEGPDALYRLAVRTAWVASALSLVIVLLLLWNYSRRIAKDPLEAADFQQLRAELAKNPKDADRKEAIRRRDLELRAAYFNHRRLAATGGWLLAGSLLLALASWRAAATMRRRLPHPAPFVTQRDIDERTAELGRVSVAALALVLIAGAAALSWGLRTAIPLDKSLATAGEGATDSAPPAVDPATKAAATAAATPAAAAAAADELRRHWHRFRGPEGSGIAPAGPYPTTWDAPSGKNIAWKSAIPLPGNNSVVLYGDRLFITGADESARKVFCYAAADGKPLWDCAIPASPQSAGRAPKASDDTGLAAPTAAADAARVYAWFANGDVGAVDRGGKLVWSRGLGVPNNDYGHAASVCLYRNLVILQFDQGGPRDNLSRLLALDAATGKTVWDAPRPVPASWATPIIYSHAGREQVFTVADPWAIAYNPADGKEWWRAKCLKQDVGPSPVFAAGMAFAVSEFPALSAIRADGGGDVSATHIAWRGEDGLPDTCSPLATDKHVYLLASAGTLTCYATADGKRLWEHDLESSFKASPALADKLIYLMGEEGKGYVLAADDEGCKEVGGGELGEACVSSPAFHDGRIYWRGADHIFCIGTK